MTTTGSANTVSQKMIADHLQVSVATVSKALSNKSDISESMRTRVEQAAKELGYRFRRSVLSGKADSRVTKFVGVFIRGPILGGAKNAPTYQDGMARVSSERNVSLVVQNWKLADDPATLLSNKHQPAALREGLLSGILLGGEWPAEVVNTLGLRHQVVMFPQSTVDCKIDVVGLDNITTMLHIVSRLKKLGHTRIGFLGRCPTVWASERFAGYVSALDRMGMAYNPDWAIDIDIDPMHQEGHQDYWANKMDRIEQMRNEQQVEAWVCSSDWPGYQLYRGMVDRGYEIPRDLSITGFDDTEPVHLGCPPITSVKVPREMIGEAALKRVLRRMENPASCVRHSQFVCQLIEHGTNGPPSYATDPSNTKVVTP